MCKIKNYNKLNEKLLKKFGIKPCYVKLERIEFSGIRISCSELTSKKNINLKWSLTQDNLNTYSLKIKRKLQRDDSDELPTQKRVKFNEVDHCSGKISRNLYKFKFHDILD